MTALVTGLVWDGWEAMGHRGGHRPDKNQEWRCDGDDRLLAADPREKTRSRGNWEEWGEGLERCGVAGSRFLAGKQHVHVPKGVFRHSLPPRGIGWRLVLPPASPPQKAVSSFFHTLGPESRSPPRCLSLPRTPRPTLRRTRHLCLRSISRT